tara:strand:- start:62 stop:175 length:114 start_codon:yes stop_codon:yes gene_type:complete
MKLNYRPEIDGLRAIAVTGHHIDRKNKKNLLIRLVPL